MFIYYVFRERELLTSYFSIMASLEYNSHQYASQQHILDELIDVSISVSSRPRFIKIIRSLFVSMDIGSF